MGPQQPGQGQAWVSGSVVNALGPIDSVALVDDIPIPPPTRTPAPPTATPRPAVDYRIVEQRLMTLQENGACNGNHIIYVQVLDPNNAPINGAVIQRVAASGLTAISGQKDCPWHIGATNEGCAQFDIYGGGDRVQVVGDPVRGSVSSEVSRHCSTQDPDIPLGDLLAAGYCKDMADCEWRMNPGGDLPRQFCNGHYSWVIKFQRTW